MEVNRLHQVWLHTVLDTHWCCECQKKLYSCGLGRQCGPVQDSQHHTGTPRTSGQRLGEGEKCNSGCRGANEDTYIHIHPHPDTPCTITFTGVAIGPLYLSVLMVRRVHCQLVQLASLQRAVVCVVLVKHVTDIAKETRWGVPP